MTPREREVVDLIDAGVPVVEIAQRTGLSKDYVRQLGRMFDFGSLGQQELHQAAAIRSQTKAHEAAILATGKRYS